MEILPSIRSGEIDGCGVGASGAGDEFIGRRVKAVNTATAPVLMPVAAVEANEIGDPYVAPSTFLACASCALLSDLTVANALAAAATAAVAAWLLSWWYRRFQDKEHAQHSNDGRGGGHSTVRTAAGAGT